MSDMAMAVRGRLRERTAEEIRVLLARRRISAAELARRTGMKQSTLARRMTGETAFDLDDLELIAEVLGVTVFDLLPKPVGQLAQITAGGGESTQSYGDEAKVVNPVIADRPIDNRPPGRGPDSGPGPRRTSRVARTGRH
jgi:transcriptional regulator with XRE-family HTH domain